jgi:hypothetical protein
MFPPQSSHTGFGGNQMEEKKPDWSVYRKILRMVQELHLRGYQRIRIAPYLAPSGIYWRCDITPVSNILYRHGAMAVNPDMLVAHYSSGMERNYFDWTDARHASPGKLAELFIERFPEIAREGKGSDWLYAGWYVEMMYLTHPDAFPCAFADYVEPGVELLTNGGRQLRLPLPPPGEAIGPTK